MLTKTREVYYCEFCKRHRLTRHSIETHEPHCIYNPERRCGWKLAHVEHRHVDVAALALELKERGLMGADDLAWLRDQTDGCPGCMLAAVVQSGLDWDEKDAWVYADEVARCREEERQAADAW